MFYAYSNENEITSAKNIEELINFLILIEKIPTAICDDNQLFLSNCDLDKIIYQIEEGIEEAKREYSFFEKENEAIKSDYFSNLI